jgi:GT2 family glycosyltransferase
MKAVDSPTEAHGADRTPPEVSVVIPVYNEGDRLCQTLTAIHDTTNVSYEAIVVNDASTDSCCDFLRSAPTPFDNVVLLDSAQRQGVARSRNLGAGRARAPVLVFMDAHCFPRPGWLPELLAELDQPNAGIVAPQISSLETPSATAFGLRLCGRNFNVEWLPRRGDQPYPVPLVGGGCMVMRKEFFESVGRFDTMRSFGVEDIEFCLRCWLFGYAVTMVPQAEIAHLFKKHPFPVGWHDHLYNVLRTAVLHFDGGPLERILASARTKPAFSEAVSSLLASDIWTRYSFVRSKRKHDAEWFCKEFAIEI